MIRADGQGLERQDVESLAGRRAVEEDLSPVQAPTDERVPAKQATRHFFDCLEELGISYCHWKSNTRLEATLAGREDIDLLVDRSEEHTSELQSLMSISYAVFCLKKKKNTKHKRHN